MASFNLRLIFLAALTKSVASDGAATLPDGTCPLGSDSPSCEPASSLLQSASGLRAQLVASHRFDYLANSLAGALAADTGAAAPPVAAGLQVAGQGSSTVAAGSSSTDSLLAQIKKQAQEAVSNAQALPQVAKDLLSNFSAEVDRMVEGLYDSHAETQEEIHLAYSELEQCESHWNNATGTIDTQNATTQDSEQAHEACRNSVGANSSVLCEGLETIIEEMRSDPLNCNVPEPRLAAECEAAPTIRPFIEGVKTWAEDYLAQYTTQKQLCQDALADDVISVTLCDEKQARYEGDFCELYTVVNVSIESYEDCRTVELDELQVLEIRNETNEVNRNEYVALKKIECYLDVLLHYDGDDQLNAQEAKLEYCNTFVVDTSMFDLTWPDEAAPLNFTSATEAVSPKPGDVAWVPLYDPAWGITEAVAPCVNV